jgi:hypothetical protein
MKNTKEVIVTIIVTTAECKSFIETFSDKTNDEPPIYTINGIDFKIEYENNDESLSKETSEFLKCKNDIGYFLENYCTLKGEPIFLRDYQKDFLTSWGNSKLKKK